MDNPKNETLESVWIPIQQKVDFYEDLILRIPQFSAIERFLVNGGGVAEGICENPKIIGIYDRIMDIAYPKSGRYVTNIVNVPELK